MAAMGMAYRALLRTSERNARATTTAAAVVAEAASTVDTGAAARFACPERRAPHTNTVGHPLTRIIYMRAGNRRAARYRFALYYAPTHSRIHRTHTHSVALAHNVGGNTHTQHTHKHKHAHMHTRAHTLRVRSTRSSSIVCGVRDVRFLQKHCEFFLVFVLRVRYLFSVFFFELPQCSSSSV